ncbi:MAG TPA: DUF1189 family protein [Geobacteraceae bacterium]|nr:DUF1189 family protein [Geobacteraceae bacterium]
MKKFSIVHIPVFSFFSQNLYREVALVWKGTCFPYLLLLLAICWIPDMVRLQLSFNDFVHNDAPKVISQVPPITIVDGTAFVDASQPYFIVDPETNAKIFIIDTTGRFTSLRGTEAYGLLTGTEAIIMKSQYETRTFTFKNVEHFSINAQRISGWLETARRYAIPTLFPFAVAGSFLYRVVQALVYALLGMLMAALCKRKLLYQSLVRLAVVAVTPCIVVATLLGIFDVTLPFDGLWYFLAAMAYLFFGIQVSRRESGDSNDPGSEPLHG